jgi:hypothetical protein
MTEPPDFSSMIDALKKTVDDARDDSLESSPPPPPPPDDPEMHRFLMSEFKALQVRQKQVQDDLQAKTREAQTLRETLLVVSGALQAVQHIAQHAGLKVSGAEAVSPV